MNKVGILTFQNTQNYGAVLQSFALQTMIKELGYNVYIINYKNDAVTQRERPMHFLLSKGLKYNLKYMLFGHDQTSKRNKINEFVKKYITLSEECNLNNKDDIFSKFDLIVTGSDQIWNINLTNHDYTYYLKGYVGKKISYAASAGITDFINDEIAYLIRDYLYVGVREKSLKEELYKYSIDSTVNIDPTMLFDKEWWNCIVAKPLIKKKYVLLYMMTKSETIIAFAKKLAKENGCILINANPISTQKFKMKCICNASPTEWLSLIKNAEYVVTNSFHGLAFSINFNKQFFTEVIDNEAKNSSRLQSLLESLNLDYRNITSDKFSEDFIDYKVVNELLNYMRISSRNYLKYSLELN